MLAPPLVSSASASVTWRRRRSVQGTSAYSASRASACRKAPRPEAASVTSSRLRSSASPAELDVPATTARSNSSPATAATSAAVRPSAERSETPMSTASRTVSGTDTWPPPASSSPRRPATTALVSSKACASSSTKKVTPRLRSWIARTSDGAGGCSKRCVSSSAVSGRLSGGTVTSVTCPDRRSSCLTRRSG